MARVILPLIGTDRREEVSIANVGDLLRETQQLPQIEPILNRVGSL